MNTSRSEAIDSIKGIAAILMVYAHTISFTQYVNNTTLKLIGDTSSLVLFIAVNGFVSVNSILLKPLNKKLFKKSARRLGIYYVAFVIMMFPEQYLRYSVTSAINHILFIQSGGYANFIVPFISYLLFILVIRIVIGHRQISWKFLVAIWVIISAVFYLLSNYIISIFWKLPVPAFLLPNIATITGCSNCGVYYPFLRYTIPLTIGIIFGIFANQFKNKIRYFLGLTVILILLYNIFTKSDIQSVVYQRWPPSISFLLVGSIMFACLYLLFTFLPLTKKVQDVLSWYGKHSLLITVSHVVAWTLIEYYFKINITTYPWVIVAFFLTLHLFIPVTALFLCLQEAYHSVVRSKI